MTPFTDKIHLPAGAAQIIDTLENAGFEADIVGGCVRDCLLGKTPNDWDIATSAKPEDVMSLFSHTVETGLKHGTVTVITDGDHFEVTTYRIDGDYGDSRHPDSVEFTTSLGEDLKRRDFTVNAMAYNPHRGLTDIFGGQEDLEQGIIRCVGNPRDRFGEDALRMMRAVRFSAQLGFDIEDDTKDAICELSDTLSKISAERVREELCKLLVSDRPRALVDLYESGLTKVFLPEFDMMMTCEQNTKHHCYTVGMHTVETVANTPNDLTLRLAMLFHDIAKPVVKKTDPDGSDHFKTHAIAGTEMTKKIMKRLRFDNDTINRVSRFVRYHDDRPGLNEKSVRKAIVRIGSDYFPDFFVIQRADIRAQSDYNRDKKTAYIDSFERIYNDIIAKGDCLAVRDMAVSGRDLIGMGIAPGPGMGDILSALFAEIVDTPSKNNREYLLKRAAEIADKNE